VRKIPDYCAGLLMDHRRENLGLPQLLVVSIASRNAVCKNVKQFTFYILYKQQTSKPIFAFETVHF